MADRLRLVRPDPAGWPSVEDLADQVFREAVRPVDVLPTGFRALDVLLDGGLRGGEVMVLAARPRVGKSSWALQTILHVADSTPVGIWSLEMAERAWLRRAVASLSGVPHHTLRTGICDLPLSEFGRVEQCIRSVGRLPLHFAIAGSDPDSFRLEAEAMVRDARVGLLVIDYLQLMTPPPNAHSRENEVASISRTVKLTARDLDVPVLLLAQLNRTAEDKQPTLSNLRESGAIEQDADEVLFLHRERDPEKKLLSNSGWAILEKNRDGEAGSFPFEFDGAHMRFTCR